MIGRVAQPQPGPTGAAFSKFDCLHALGPGSTDTRFPPGQAELLRKMWTSLWSM
jgi:hypothetical protein